MQFIENKTFDELAIVPRSRGRCASRTSRWPNAARSPVDCSDGPLGFDNAVSKQAAKTKGIVSVVAGDADILVAPDLESGNIMAKQLIYLAGADAAGIVLGALVPVVLTSRADGTLARQASCALAQLLAHHRTSVCR